MGVSPGQYRRREEAAPGLDTGAARDPGRAIQNPASPANPSPNPANNVTRDEQQSILVAESQGLAAFALPAAVEANVGVVSVRRFPALADPDRRELLCFALHGVRAPPQNRPGAPQKTRSCPAD